MDISLAGLSLDDSERAKALASGAALGDPVSRLSARDAADVLKAALDADNYGNARRVLEARAGLLELPRGLEACARHRHFDCTRWLPSASLLRATRCGLGRALATAIDNLHTGLVAFLLAAGAGSGRTFEDLVLRALAAPDFGDAARERVLELLLEAAALVFQVVPLVRSESFCEALAALQSRADRSACEGVARRVLAKEQRYF